ncbi:hypothetical protein Taro_016446 [Colocasia esculenta]|uniref:Uncharacterized protein n=1 Tax=Colocasia esculenta TaxID=4460 RepID=A0A843UWA3_COLES|nr:hypothetical protein [Colocasia esculenta]
MDVRVFGPDNLLSSSMQHPISIQEQVEKAFNAPICNYVQDAKAMASTATVVKEHPNSTSPSSTCPTSSEMR